MQSRLAVLFLLAALVPWPAAAAPLEEASASAYDCVRAELLPLETVAGGQVLYRIVFQNYCGTTRSLFWCAEHPARPVPAAIACASARALGAEVRQLIRVRREFQWHLPAGARIRHRDCPPNEVPTPEFGCEPAPVAAPRR
jgi:hypothetical protein